MIKKKLFIGLLVCLLCCPVKAQGWLPLVKSAGGGGFSLTAGTNVGSATIGTTSISYAGVTWGSGCNAVVFVVYWYNTAATDTITALTVGGSGVTHVLSSPVSTAAGGQSLDVWQITPPSGTSGTVAVTYSANVTFNSNVTPYCLVSAHTTAGTPATNANTSCAAGVSATATVPTGGQAVVGASSDAGQVISFTNATSDGVYTGGGTQDRWGHTTATGSVTVTATSAAADHCPVVVVPYGP